MIITKRVNGYKNYTVNNQGEVFNVKTKHKLTPYKRKIGRQYYIQLSKNNITQNFNLAKLVCDHFKKKELHSEYVKHLNFTTEDNRNKNLKRCTRGDLRRHYNQGKKRGVYTWTDGIRQYYRATLKIDDKCKTIGYYKKRKDAVIAYKAAFLVEYGMLPF
jgi:hypothetical protein